MQLITTTELRTKSKDLVAALLAGRSVNLIHRSKIVGEIKPKEEGGKIFSAKRVEKLIQELNFPPLTNEEIEKRYRNHIMKKYGQGLSRHQ